LPEIGLPAVDDCRQTVVDKPYPSLKPLKYRDLLISNRIRNAVIPAPDKYFRGQAPAGIRYFQSVSGSPFHISFVSVKANEGDACRP
jgi:hypothetical protein